MKKYIWKNTVQIIRRIWRGRCGYHLRFTQCLMMAVFSFCILHILRIILHRNAENIEFSLSKTDIFSIQTVFQFGICCFWFAFSLGDVELWIYQHFQCAKHIPKCLTVIQILKQLYVHCWIK